MTIKAGDLVMAARGTDDEDVGRVHSVDGDVAVVGWVQGITTTCSVAKLEPITAIKRLEWLSKQANRFKQEG